MKKLMFLFVFAISLFADTYYVNEKDSKITFEATKFLFLGVDGKFSKFEGSVIISKEGKVKSINGLVEASSIDTDNKDRDSDLRSRGYFNTKSYPMIKFNSIGIKDNLVKAIINIKGLSEEIDFKLSNIILDSSKISFELDSSINREDFNLSGAKSSIINKIVAVKAKIVANK